MDAMKLLLVFCALAHVSLSEKKVVCYFTNWAWYRPDIGKYMPENIDSDLCTHINYAFATLDTSSLIMKPFDGWADIDNKFYSKVVAYRKGMKVLIAIGGWNDSAGDKYHRLVTDPAARANFVKNALDFCHQYGFDGIDLDWEYPVCPQNICSDQYADDRDAFTAWVKELAEAFHAEGLLVTAAVSANNERVDTCYDVPSISTHLDFINVMTYDFHGQWDKKTGHVSPLYAHPDDVNPNFNMNYSINYWIESGADPQKLVLGIPFHGQSFTLADSSNNGLNAQSSNGGNAGTYTRQMGFLSYYEICHNIKELGWTVVQDPLGTMGSYAYSGNQWVSYDDAAMVQTKAQYIQDNNLGGAMIWALDLDDFIDRCGEGKYPLLKTINRVLRGYSR